MKRWHEHIFRRRVARGTREVQYTRMFAPPTEEQREFQVESWRIALTEDEVVAPGRALGRADVLTLAVLASALSSLALALFLTFMALTD